MESCGCRVKGNGCHSTLRIIFVFLGLSLFSVASAWAQEVYVFEDPEAESGSTVRNYISNQGDFRILVIPVVLQGSPFDPENNLLSSYDPLNPNLRQDLVDRYAEMNDYWQEASNGQVSFTADVLERFYQLPRDQAFYFHPTYRQPVTEGSPTLTAPVEVPEGRLQLDLHISDADETLVTIEFLAGDSPYTLAQLKTHIADQIRDQVGDKLEVETALGKVVFAVARRHAEEGGYVRLRETGNDPELLDALGLDTPVIDIEASRVLTQGVEFPLDVTVDAFVQLTVEHESAATETFSWSIASANFPTVADFVAAHGEDLSNATISVEGEELQFALTPASPDPLLGISIMVGPHFVADGLGLDEIRVTEGTVTQVNGDSIKGDRRLIAGQAIAAYMLNELTRPADGDDDIPNIDITAANEADLDASFSARIDPYHGVSVVFLDVAGKRGGASGGYLDMGIENGDYLYKYQSYGDIQLVYRSSLTGTIAHETGHNIGFPDLYDNGGGNYDPALRYANDWDIMDAAVLNHPGAWMKIIDSDWVRDSGGAIDTFPMPASPGLRSRSYVLTPLEYGADSYDSEIGGAPAERTLAKSIRLPLGLGSAAEDHYLLVQNRQTGPRFSQTLPTAAGASVPGGLYITDAITHRVYDYFEIDSRNYVHPLTDSALVAGTNVSPVLDQAPADDIDLESAYPAYAGITVDIVGELPGPAGAASAASYLVDIGRQQSDFLDLRIEPWGAPPYETPDIWIEHGDSEVSELSEEPLEGNGEPARWSESYDPEANDGQPLNWIRVQVTNEGTVTAEEVQVQVKVNTPGGLGDNGSWSELPLSQPLEVPAGESRIFNIPWNPSVDSHTCVEAEVFRWTSVLGDLNPSNNGTQENINAFQPTPGSSWRPETFQVEVFNALDRALDIELETSGLPPGFAVKFDRKFFTLPARGAVLRQVSLQVDEAFYPSPQSDGAGGLRFFEPTHAIDSAKADQRRQQSEPYYERFNVKGYVVTPGHYRVPIGGLTYDVRPTQGIEIDVQVTGDGAGGIVVGGNTEPPAGHQSLEIEIVYPSGRHTWTQVITDRDGTFEKTVAAEEEGRAQITVIYPRGQLFAAARTGARYVDPRIELPAAAEGTPLCIPCILQWLFWIVVLLLLLWIVLVLMRLRKQALASHNP